MTHEGEPRVFVGTMYCGEGEFRRSVGTITSQEGVQLTHKIVKDLPELEAHRELYSAWNAAKTGYDMFVQVDADTTLRDEVTLRECWKTLQTAMKDGYTAIQAPLHDCMTDEWINGLNCYSTLVEFVIPTDDLFCDRTTKNNKTLLADAMPPRLKPAGLHMSNPLMLQAFHFGVHRGLKNQHNIESRIKVAFSKDPTKARLYALWGFMKAKEFKTNRRFNYNDPEFIAAYEAACEEMARGKSDPAYNR
jgi:hypothetical protein